VREGGKGGKGGEGGGVRPRRLGRMRIIRWPHTHRISDIAPSDDGRAGDEGGGGDDATGGGAFQQVAFIRAVQQALIQVAAVMGGGGAGREGREGLGRGVPCACEYGGQPGRRGCWLLGR
jgi:hypothetical protein